MANIYVDSSASGLNDGTTMTDAYTSIVSAVSTRSAGDRIWVRRTHAENLTSDLQIVTPASSADNPLAIVGWPISGDELYATRPSDTASWDSDSTAAFPTFTMNAANTGFDITIDGLLLQRLKLAAAAVSTSGLLKVFSSGKCVAKDCILDMSLTTASIPYVVLANNLNTYVVLENCTTTNKTAAGYSLYVAIGTIVVIGGSIDGGDYVTRTNDGSLLLEGVAIGGTTAPDVAVLHSVFSFGPQLFLGCDINGVSFSPSGASSPTGPAIFLDSDGVAGEFYAEHLYSSIEKVASPARVGGADHSYVFTATNTLVNTKLGMPWSTTQACVFGFPFTLSYGFPAQLPGDSFSIYAQSAGSITISVYIYTRNWSTLPTSDQVYLTASYMDTAAGGRARVRSTEQVSANATWTALTVTVNPAAASLIHLNLNMAVYESGAPARDILIDPLPVIQ